ncbi:MAG TPA: NADH-quinone oxidoreductase subunit I [Clostridia bacterium]|nr:NADH-quinone oxidoreductase subunit I [Clostridia bacterium]
MFGTGLLKGLRVTAKHLVGKAITEQYPERKPNLPPRSHGSFSLEPDKCNACGVCSNSCPNSVITVLSDRDENKKRFLTGYYMDLGFCLFCGLCVEACPNDALHVENDFELSAYRRGDVVLTLYAREQQKQVANE